MNSLARSSIFIILLFAAMEAEADIPELLIPAVKSSETKVRATNRYFLERETFFAKRYRIVTVDTEALRESELVRISLFEDQTITVKVASINVHPDDSGIDWTGNIIDTPLTADELVEANDSLTLEQATTLLPYLTSLRISAGQVSFDKETNLKYPYYFPQFNRFERESKRYSKDGKSGIYDVTFTLNSVAVPSGVYELRPLAMDPRHHVLVELDPQKVFSKPVELHDHTLAPEESTANEVNKRRYREFLDELGPDPRPASFHREGHQ